ncbi:hypothetical protein T459_29767 [Capsicum annuum]|uniref:Uncharacterized protein n=1 Tax=Capsicum annuum TaxID=4072 RepID=A0A2G2Y6K3_CAPAN|nr:hypothetical protein T459_29767 [Capsicum annuum]
MPMWRTNGIILTALIHVGPVEFLYYSLHRTLHHHFHCSKRSAAARASEDFMPRDPTHQTLHIASVAFNSLLMGRLWFQIETCSSMNAPVMFELEGETDLLEALLEGMDTPYVDAVEKFEVKKLETKNDEVIEMEMLLGEVFDAVLLGTM